MANLTLTHNIRSLLFSFFVCLIIDQFFITTFEVVFHAHKKANSHMKVEFWGSGQS